MILYNLFKFYGQNSMDNIKTFIEKVLTKHIGSDCTFEELYVKTKKKLIIVATNVTDKELGLFSEKTTPNVKVSDAICASMSFPFVFSPYEINKKLYIDGGLLMNYSPHVFSKLYNIDEKKVFGIKIYKLEDKDDCDNDSLFEYINSIIKTVVNYCEDYNEVLDNQIKKNTIVIEYDIDLKIFNTDMTNERKSLLISLGNKSCENFIKKYKK